jgi:hypothetical protein
MKTIKIILWLIILGLLGTLIYQNKDYFMATVILDFDLKISTWHWAIPELPNIAYFGICFLLGIILMGIKTIAIKFRLNKEIKIKNAKIESLEKQVNTIKTDLEVFQHDPYIKKELAADPNIEEPVVGEPVVKEPKEAVDVSKEENKSDTAD